MTNTIESILARVSHDSPTGCWLWQGYVNKGYGHVTFEGKSGRSVHRIIYTALKEDVPSTLDLHHTCPNKHCCNPAHLEPLPHPEHIRLNRIDGQMCRKGLHVFTGDNILDYKGRRRCRHCHNQNQQKYYHARKRV